MTREKISAVKISKIPVRKNFTLTKYIKCRDTAISCDSTNNHDAVIYCNPTISSQGIFLGIHNFKLIALAIH